MSFKFQLGPLNYSVSHMREAELIKLKPKPGCIPYLYDLIKTWSGS